MVTTRKGTGTGDDTSKTNSDTIVADKENVNPVGTETAKDVGKITKGVKRKPEELETSKTKKQKMNGKGNATPEKEESTRSKNTPKKEKSVPRVESSSKKEKSLLAEPGNITKKSQASKKKDKDKEKDEAEKPRLTTPDIEFEYDRSQLRDPRTTPGRNAKPRYDEIDILEGLRAEISLKFHVPKPERPKVD